MKLLIVTQVMDKQHPILGFFHRWVEAFASECERVYVICLQEGEHNLPDNVQVLSLGKEGGESRLKYLANFYRYVLPLIFGRKVDRIFVHMNEIYILLLAPFYPLIRLLNIRYIWWKAHGNLGKLSRFVRFFVTKIATSNPWGFSVKTQKKTVIGQGIDSTFFVPPFDPQERERGSIIVVGRASPVKGYESVVKMLSYLPENISVTIIGVDDKTSSYVEKLKKLAEELGVQKRFILKPSVNQQKLRGVYQKSDILVNVTPGTIDKVILEAMACEVVSISSSEPVAHILQKYNLFVPKGNAKMLAQTVNRVREMTPKARLELGQKMRKEVIDNHSLKRFVQKILCL